MKTITRIITALVATVLFAIWNRKFGFKKKKYAVIKLGTH